MNKSESIKELATALCLAQGEMPAVQFNSVNPFLKNKYADLGAIISTSKPILTKYGLSVTQLTETQDNSVGVTTILMHKSGEWMQSTASLQLGEEKGKSLAQVAGSIITYLRRYSLASILGMYADEDGDGNEPKKADDGKKATPTNGNGHKPLIQAIQDEGGVPVTQPEGDKPEYKGKTAKFHQHTYPLSWTSKLIATFVTPGKLNVPHLDGILQKLNLSFDTDIDTVISAVNDYAKENAQN